MPAYDYRCPVCDHVFEVVRAISDRTDVVCPSCETTAKRLFSPVGVVFKGSGFHNTDYRPRPKSEESPSGPKETCTTGGAGCASCPSSQASVSD